MSETPPETAQPKPRKRPRARRRIVTAAQRVSPSYFAVLAVISGLILTLGWFLRPRESGNSLPSETDSGLVERLAQRRVVDGMSEYFSERAAELAQYIAWVESLGHSGVLWERDGLVVTSHGQNFAPKTSSVTYGGSRQRAATAVFGSPLAPIAAYRAASYDGDLAVPRLGPEFLDTDAWLLTVWRPNAGNFAFAPGIFAGTRAGVCGEFPMAEIITNVPFNSSMVGAGVFDLDGALVGLVVSCPEGAAAMAVGSVESAVASSQMPTDRVVSRYGFVASLPASEAERELFKELSALVVTGVWFDTAADRAGLLPGDVIRAAAGEEEEILQTLATHPRGEPLPITVLRGRREIRLRLSDEAPRAPRAGLSLTRPDRGVPVESVSVGGAAATSGLRPGDALLSVGGQTVTSRRDAVRLLGEEFGQPAWVVVRRGPSLRGFVLSPPEGDAADTSA